MANRSGSGFGTGGGLPSLELPKDHKDAYHSVLGMSAHDMELMREAAAQQAGFSHSDMWGKMKRQPMASSRFQFEKIMRSHHPSIVGKMLEQEKKSNNGKNFLNAVGQTISVARDHIPTLVASGTKVAAQIAKQMPFFAGAAVVPTVSAVGSLATPFSFGRSGSSAKEPELAHAPPTEETT